MVNMRVRIFACFSLVDQQDELSNVATVSATFFESSFVNPPAKTADLILPITTPTPSVEDNIASVPPDVTVSFLSEEINISP